MDSASAIGPSQQSSSRTSATVSGACLEGLCSDTYTIDAEVSQKLICFRQNLQSSTVIGIPIYRDSNLPWRDPPFPWIRGYQLCLSITRLLAACPITLFREYDIHPFSEAISCNAARASNMLHTVSALSTLRCYHILTQLRLLSARPWIYTSYWRTKELFYHLIGSLRVFVLPF